MNFLFDTNPTLWKIYVGQLGIAFITVLCFMLVLRRLNQNLVTSLRHNMDLAVKKQELNELVAADLERKRAEDARLVSAKVVEAAEGVRIAVIEQAEDVRHKVEEAVALAALPVKVEVVNTPLVVKERKS